MARTFAPVTSFGQELHEALRAGADKRIELKFDNEKMAIRFNQRINALRNAMKKENHPDWIQLYRCQCRREGAKLILAPADSEFREVLDSAGVKNISPAPPTTKVNITTPEPGKLDVDSLFTDLVEATRLPKDPDDASKL
jgi:hypothetical protein